MFVYPECFMFDLEMKKTNVGPGKKKKFEVAEISSNLVKLYVSEKKNFLCFFIIFDE